MIRRPLEGLFLASLKHLPTPKSGEAEKPKAPAETQRTPTEKFRRRSVVRPIPASPEMEKYDADFWEDQRRMDA